MPGILDRGISQMPFKVDVVKLIHRGGYPKAQGNLVTGTGSHSWGLS